ncbi:response regulator [Zunongwangia sp. F260]|uniref:Response regulator n=1 Tax=Autumnicola lenta TaxID=3075593 RepID=A0ABU3CJP6_9FLAO|nr:response regulator [Zunongwangia sp. F260]MDT0646452.1 response regulator [Zunongwangia sp. F260]
MEKLFLLIDDDNITNLVNRKILQDQFPTATIVDFNVAKTALDFVMNEFRKSKMFQIIIFLDINMPEISGWEVITILEKDAEFQYHLYLLTSSIDKVDKAKSEEFSSVLSFISKPLTIQKIQHLNLNQ